MRLHPTRTPPDYKGNHRHGGKRRGGRHRVAFSGNKQFRQFSVLAVQGVFICEPVIVGTIIGEMVRDYKRKYLHFPAILRVSFPGVLPFPQPPHIHRTLVQQVPLRNKSSHSQNEQISSRKHLFQVSKRNTGAVGVHEQRERSKKNQKQEETREEQVQEQDFIDKN